MRLAVPGCSICAACGFRHAGFEPEIALATDDRVAVQAMVAAHLGVTLLPALVLDTVTPPDVRIRPVRGRPTRTVSALTLSAAGAAPGIRALIEALTGQARRRPTRLRWDVTAGR